MLILPHHGVTPVIDSTAFVAPGAVVIGDVTVGADSSIWFNSVVRGDVHSIRIGERTNIQDGCVLHVTHALYPLVIGSGVTVGHAAILHGARIADHCLIGMGATVLDNARIGSYSLVAAGSLVQEHFEVPEGSLVAGVPARIKRRLTSEERERIVRSATNYVRYVSTYRS
jgi:carbonic anhydrase/acetyltransferase-like protein (isoleucine patch superfamily)